MSRARARVRRALRAVAVVVVVAVVAVFTLFAAWREPDRPVEALTAQWAPPPSTFVDVSGLRVHVRDEGRRDDPLPIVLLHGTSASLHTWDGWTEALVREDGSNRRVIRFDLPGFGLTGPTADGVYSIDRYVDVVIGVTQALGVRSFIVGGNSLGGYVAWATALRDRSAVVGLILVDAAGLPFQSQSVPLAFTIARTPVLNQLVKDVLPRGLVRRSLENVYGDPTKVTDALVDRYLALNTRAGNRAALVARFEQTQPSALALKLTTITTPTLIVWGKDDRLIPPAVGQEFANDIRDSVFVVFDGLGHVPHEEDPATTVAAVQRFLRDEVTRARTPDRITP